MDKHKQTVIHTQLFQDDDGGWHYEITIWKGDHVDLAVDKPLKIVKSKGHYPNKYFAAETLVHEFASALGVHNR